MSLRIGQFIKNVLESDIEVGVLVEDRIYPVAIPQGTEKPFVCYSNINILGEYTKDGWIGDTTTLNIICVSDNYEEAVDLADNARVALEGANRFYAGIGRISEGQMLSSEFSYENDLYVITMTMSFTTTAN